MSPQLALTLFDQSIQDNIKAGNWPFAIAGLVNNIVLILLFAIGVLSVIFIIIGGLFYITSGGDERRIRFAKRALIAAIGGLIGSLVLGGVLQFIFNTFFTGHP